MSQIKKQLTPTLKKIMQDEVKEQARFGSSSANWYLNATELVPHPVTKMTTRNLGVNIHRLRLGYKATWQMIEGMARQCNYCEDTPDHPLLHYLLECTATSSLRGRMTIPDTTCEITATRLVKNIIESMENHSRFLIEKPPPR